MGSRNVPLAGWIYYDAINYTYGYPYEGSGANHAVTLVGWDDSFDKNNFPAASKVTRNGAWIAKNSWGSEWGEGDIFYISYDNKSNYNIVAEGATAAPAYSNNYFYDGSSALSSLSLKKQTASSEPPWPPMYLLQPQEMETEKFWGRWCLPPTVMQGLLVYRYIPI